MPTGYTYQIEKGISLENFVMFCARAFGALVTMRDDPMDIPIPEEFKPSPYHAERLAEVSKEFDMIMAFTPDQCSRRARERYKEEKERYEKNIEEEKDLKQKYEAMLEQVRAWTPPTTDHQGLKNFMMEQIRISIPSDDYWKRKLKGLKCLSGEEWKDEKIASIKQDIEYYTKEQKEEIERVNGRNLWIRQLRESLKGGQNAKE